MGCSISVLVQFDILLWNELVNLKHSILRANNLLVAALLLTPAFSSADSGGLNTEIDWIGYQWGEIEHRAPYKIELSKSGTLLEEFYCHTWPSSWKEQAVWAKQAARCVNRNSGEIQVGVKNADGTISEVRHNSDNKVWAPDVGYEFELISNALDLVEIGVLWPQWSSLEKRAPIQLLLSRGGVETERFICDLDDSAWSAQTLWSEALAICLNEQSELMVSGQLVFETGEFVPVPEASRNRVLAPSADYQLKLEEATEPPPEKPVGSLALSLPEAPVPELEGEVVTGRAVNSVNGEVFAIEGEWGSTITLSDLNAGDYQILMHSAQGYVPYNSPVVLTLSEEQDSSEYALTYRPPVEADLLEPLPGVSVELFYEGLYQPRQMTMGNGVLYVGSSAIPLDDDTLSGHLYAIELDAETGKAGDAYVVATGLEEPHGVAYRDGSLYYSTVGGLYRIEDIDRSYKTLPAAERIYTYPADNGEGLEPRFRVWHQKHPIKFNPLDPSDNGIYTAVGIPCNVCIMPDELYGTLYRIDLDSLETTVMAKGIRNSVGFDWHPLSGEIWFSDNNRQGMDNPDEINRISQRGEHFGTPYVFGRDTIGILPEEEADQDSVDMPFEAILSDLTIAEIYPDNYVATAFEVETNSAPLGVVFWDGFPSKANQHHLLFATHGNGQKAVRPALELRMLTIEDSTRVAHERSLVQGWMQDIDNVDSYACLNNACIGRPMELLPMADGSLLLSDDKANVLYRIRYEADAVSDSRVILNVPQLPDLALESELIHGRLLQPNGEERRFYMDWNSSALSFDGMPAGEYQLLLDTVAGWYPQPAAQSFTLESDSDRVSLDWSYSSDTDTATMVLQAPERPFGLVSEETEVSIRQGNNTQKVTLTWGEVRSIKLPPGSYVVSFGYDYGALPSPLDRAVILREAGEVVWIDWNMRMVTDVGDVVLNESCASCHGEGSSGLATKTIAETWFTAGFDQLVQKVKAMPMYCDGPCGEQTARTLWQERWAEFNPPEIPDGGEPEPGEIPSASWALLDVENKDTLIGHFDYFTDEGDFSGRDITSDDLGEWISFDIPYSELEDITSLLVKIESRSSDGDSTVQLSSKESGLAPKLVLTNGEGVEISVQTVADAHVHKKNPNTNFGNNENLYLKYVSGGSEYNRKAAIKFDLVDVKLADFDRAQLKLHVRNVSSGPWRRLRIARLEHNDWSEDSVTWNNLPSYRWVEARPIHPKNLKRQDIQYRYLQPEVSPWQTVLELEPEERSFEFSPEYGGQLEVRIVSVDQNNGVTYSPDGSVVVDGVPTQSVSNEGLELFWDFDTPSPFKVVDRSGNGLDLPLNGQTFIQDGAVNDALRPGRYKIARRLSEEEQMDLDTNGMTWSFWLYSADGLNYRQRLFNYQDSNGGLFAHVASNRNMRIGTGSGSRFVLVDKIPNREWVHITYVRQPNNKARAYVNGVEVKTASHTTPATLTKLDLNEFRNNSALDELRLYSRVLSPAEILSLYTRPNESDKDGDGNNGGGEEPPVGDMDGEELWKHFNCAACHGEDGNGDIPILDALFREDIIEYLMTNMPLGNPGQCDRECAEKLYEWTYKEFIGNGGGTPPSGGSDSGLDAVVTSWEAQSFYYKMTENLVSRQPFNEEVEQVRNYGGNAIDTLLTDLLEEESFLLRVEEVFNDLLNVRGTPDLRSGGRNIASANGGHFEWFENAANGNTTLRNYLRAQTELALGREPSALIRHIITTDQPFNRILTAEYTMVNFFSASYYGVADQLSFRELDNPQYPDFPWDPEDFQPVKLTHPQAGVLTNPAFLLTYPTTATNINRARAAHFYEKFLDTDIMAIGGDRPGSDDLEDDNATLTNPACTGCHEVMDPVASAFKHWIGEDRPSYKANLSSSDWPLGRLLPVGFNGEEAGYYQEKPLLWVVERAAEDPRFARAMVKHLFMPITGHELITVDEVNADGSLAGDYQRQQQDLSRLAQRFEASGYSIKALIRELVFTDYTQRFNRFGGSRLMLTPDMLDRKITSLFGRDWRYRGGYRWLHRDAEKLNLMYGGIDDVTTTERDYRLNGVSAGIQNFLAADLSCQMVSFEFSQASNDRSIFGDFGADGYRKHYELEDGELSGGAEFETVSAQRFTGRGYVAITDQEQSISFDINLEYDDLYDLSMSYAFNASNDRYVELWINDELIQEIQLQSTGGGARWQNAKIEPLYLEKGSHQIRLVKVGNDGRVNLDNLAFRPLAEDEQRTRKLIADLMWRFYGENEDVESDRKEVEQAYQLFRNVQQMGRTLVYSGDVDARLPTDCRAHEHLMGNEELYTKDHVDYDSHFYTRSWIALMMYLLKDQRFFYE
ncbi:DUF7594 domain-containing protein [Vibrio maritimus]|uniref:CBM96 family carbohydrate-binding protein n=1 Tax=Vibrio maritimus TaxID=990268 RepID=UPI001F1DF0BA|nr:LamG-like jellyroll fold domain-containing protein [Vibrio maritimus]